MSLFNLNNVSNRPETDGANRIQSPSWHRPIGEPHSFGENLRDPRDVRNPSETDSANGIQSPNWDIQSGESYFLVENRLDRKYLEGSFSHSSDPDQSDYIRTSFLSPQPNSSEDSVVSDRSQNFTYPANQPGTSQNGVHDYSSEVEDSSVSPSTVPQTENENNYENGAWQSPSIVPSPEVIDLGDSETEEESSDGVGSYNEEGSSNEDISNPRESKRVRLPKERRKHTKCALCERGCSYMLREMVKTLNKIMMLWMMEERHALCKRGYSYMLREMVKMLNKIMKLWMMEERKHEKCGKRGLSFPSRHISSDLSKACKKHDNKIHHKNQRSRRTRENTPGN